MNIRLSGIIKESIVDGPGIRYVIFTQGCTHNCYLCHNPSTHDISGGYLKPVEEIANDVKSLSYINGLTISGGEPFLQIDACLALLKNLCTGFNKDVIVYTGFTFEHLKNLGETNQNLAELFKHIDYLIDGKYDYQKRDLTLRYRGSSNQRIIDVKKSLRDNKINEVEL